MPTRIQKYVLRGRTALSTAARCPYACPLLSSSVLWEHQSYWISEFIAWLLTASPAAYNSVPMDEATRNEIADCLENLASQKVWNPEVWQRCYDLVGANWDDDLLAYVHDDLIHYSGEFHSRNIFGLHVKPDRAQLEQYRQEFRDVAAALRERLSLLAARKKYDF